MTGSRRHRAGRPLSRAAPILALRLALLPALLVFAPFPAAALAVDFDAVEREAAEFLAAYLRIDTTNPPGNETAAARFLAERFAAEGIEARVLEPQPGRGSVVARLRGSGKKPPIVLLNHLDVVPADASEWRFPPFAGTRSDGYVHGRGALDCKGIGVVEAVAMFVARRGGLALDRDVIFLGTADEEAGGKLGAGWIVAEHREEIAGAEFVLNEGGAIRALPGGARVFEVAVAEKTPCWLRLTAAGPPGHGSSPPAETSVTRLLRALDRVRGMPPRLRVSREVQAHYAALAETHTGELRRRYRDLRASLADPKFRARFLADRHDAALVRNTIAPTVLSGSPKTNVIPSAASAEIDCRLLPGEDPEAFVASIRQRIDDPEVRVDVLLNFPPSASPADTTLFRTLAKLAEGEGAPVVPSVLTGFTDSHYFREMGIASYGFVPFVLPEEESDREHGVDERVSTANLRDGVRRLLDVLRRLDGE